MKPTVESRLSSGLVGAHKDDLLHKQLHLVESRHIEVALLKY